MVITKSCGRSPFQSSKPRAWRSWRMYGARAKRCGSPGLASRWQRSHLRRAIPRSGSWRHGGHGRNRRRHGRPNRRVRQLEPKRAVNILLDTHIWIWSIMSPEKLGIRLRRQIEDSRHALFLSPVSIWEAKLFLERKAYRVSIPFPRWVERAFTQYDIHEAPLNFAVAAEAASIVLP